MSDVLKGELVTVIGRHADDIEDGVRVDYFLWKNPGFENAEKKLRDAVKRFLQTDEGKEITKRDGGFTWGGALMGIPYDFWVSQNLFQVSGETDIRVTYLSVVEVDIDKDLT